MKLEKALEYLNALIAEGVEYPDAEWLASQKFNVLHNILRNAYDKQQRG